MYQSKYIHSIEIASKVDKLAELLHFPERNPCIQAAIFHHQQEAYLEFPEKNDMTLDILHAYNEYCKGQPITHLTPIGTVLLIMAHFLNNEDME